MSTYRLRLTMFTPPDWYTEHMAMSGARPMVVPWKDMPLQEGGERVTREGAETAVPVCPGAGGHQGVPWPL